MFTKLLHEIIPLRHGAFNVIKSLRKAYFESAIRDTFPFESLLKKEEKNSSENRPTKCISTTEKTVEGKEIKETGETLGLEQPDSVSGNVNAWIVRSESFQTLIELGQFRQ